MQIIHRMATYLIKEREKIQTHNLYNKIKSGENLPQSQENKPNMRYVEESQEESESKSQIYSSPIFYPQWCSGKFQTKPNGLDILLEACDFVEKVSSYNFLSVVDAAAQDRSNPQFWRACSFESRISKIQIENIMKKDCTSTSPSEEENEIAKSMKSHFSQVIFAKYEKEQNIYWPAKVASIEEIESLIKVMYSVHKSKVKIIPWNICNKPSDNTAVVFLGTRDLCCVKFKNSKHFNEKIHDVDLEMRCLKSDKRRLYQMGIEAAKGIILRKSNEVMADKCSQCEYLFGKVKNTKKAKKDENVENKGGNKSDGMGSYIHHNSLHELTRITCIFCNVSTHFSCFATKEQLEIINKMAKDDRKNFEYICQICKFRFPLSCNYINRYDEAIEAPLL